MNDIIVAREKILRAFEEVQPGLSTREITDQSSCFVFKGGRVITYNEEVFCSAKSTLPKELEGGVEADKLTQFLRKLKDPEITLSFSDNTLKVKGTKREGIEFPFRKEILLPLDQVEVAGKWRKIHKEFADAVNIVQQSASQDQSEQITSCIHIHPKFIEASDGRQLTRYKIKTGVEKPFLVRRDSIKFIATVSLKEISETEKCIHFRSDTGLIISARRYMDQYQDMSAALKEEGEPIILPKGLTDAMEKCELVTQVDKDNNFATIHLTKGEIKVTGISQAGRYWKTFKNVKYNGKDLKFKIPPKLMGEILRRHTDCEITDSFRVKINGGKFTYMAALIQENETPQQEQ